MLLKSTVEDVCVLFAPPAWPCVESWKYYDIREYFQGRDEKGKMKNKSDDKNYMELLSNLKVAIAVLAKKIEQKVYEYGFLMK